MANGARTRDLQDHNQTLYQLSYSHHVRQGATVLYYDRNGAHFSVADRRAASSSAGVISAMANTSFR